MESQQHVSMRDYGRVIVKRRKVVGAFAILGLAIGLYSYFTSARAYQATSEVLIERPSGYIISANVGGLGTATSTKQQTHFLETEHYQRLARALTDMAPIIHLDLTDPSTLDDISTVIQTQILNSEFVTPVRLVLYDLPGPSLLSFQQSRTLTESLFLGQNLRAVTKMAMATEFNLSAGWMRGRPGPSDRAVRDNIRIVAAAPMVQSWQALGVTDAAASEGMATTEDETGSSAVAGARLALAARTIGALSDLDKVAKTDKARGRNITELTSTPDVLKAAGEIMKSEIVANMEYGPGVLNWFALSPKDKQAKIQMAAEALWLRNRKHPQPTEAVWSVTGKEVQDGADIISISQVAPSPAQARLAANAMAAVMVWEDRMTKVAEAERSVRFLTQQLGNDNFGATKNLRKKEDDLTAFRKTNRLLDAETQLKAAAEQAGSLEAQIGQTRASIQESEAALRKTVEQLGGTNRFNIAPTIRQNPLIDSVKADLIRAETELAGLRAQGYTDEWPALMNAKAMLENLQKRLSAEIHNTVERQYSPDPVHSGLQAKAAELASTQVGLEARKVAIGRLLGDMDGRFASLPQKQAEMVRLVRAQSIAERQYMDLYGRLIDAKNNRAMRQGNARVVSVALEPGKKVAPRIRNILVAILMGAFLGCLCALALSSTDTHLRDAEDVQRELKIPVLAHLPALPRGDALVVEAMPASAATEALRSLRSTIRFMGQESPLKTLAATSTHTSVAKSAVVANLAASLAQAGVTVTAVDADMRHPSLASFFGRSAASGLSEILAGGKPAADAREATRIPALFLLSAGAVPPNPAELLEGGRIAKVLEELGEGNDMVIIDTPPIGAVSDAAVIGSAADATILVIETGAVRPEEARAALAKLTQSARTRVLGVVLVGGEAPATADYLRYTRTTENNANADGATRPRGKAKA